MLFKYDKYDIDVKPLLIESGVVVYVVVLSKWLTRFYEG